MSYYVQTSLALLAVAYMGIRSYKRSSLDNAGICAAMIVGAIHAVHPYRLITLLLSFFLTGTRLTHWGEEIKEELVTSSAKKGRTATQVLCNSGPATILALLTYRDSFIQAFQFSHSWHDLLVLGIVAQYACSAADTFSSEIGILNDDWPLLITTMRKVPPGTNGAVSVLGLMAALMGGGIIGLVAAVAMPCARLKTRIALFVVGVFAGLAGSLIDSILGATMQKTVYDQGMKKVVERHGGVVVRATPEHDDKNKYIIIGVDVLDNNMVNLVSALLTMAITMMSVGFVSLVSHKIMNSI